jgi:quinoprotein glucose dehydrogenase
VFVAATLDPALRAFDIETGRELWKGPLPASGKATPMTFRGPRDGRQYVVIAAGGDGGEVFGSSDAIVAFRLR